MAFKTVDSLLAFIFNDWCGVQKTSPCIGGERVSNASSPFPVDIYGDRGLIKYARLQHLFSTELTQFEQALLIAQHDVRRIKQRGRTKISQRWASSVYIVGREAQQALPLKDEPPVELYVEMTLYLLRESVSVRQIMERYELSRRTFFRLLERYKRWMFGNPIHPGVYLTSHTRACEVFAAYIKH